MYVLSYLKQSARQRPYSTAVANLEKNGGQAGLPGSCKYVLDWACKQLGWALKLVVKTNFTVLEGGLEPVKASPVESPLVGATRINANRGQKRKNDRCEGDQLQVAIWRRKKGQTKCPCPVTTKLSPVHRARTCLTQMHITQSVVVESKCIVLKTWKGKRGEEIFFLLRMRREEILANIEVWSMSRLQQDGSRAHQLPAGSELAQQPCGFVTMTSSACYSDFVYI